jgi:hypothetical protein
VNTPALSLSEKEIDLLAVVIAQRICNEDPQARFRIGENIAWLTQLIRDELVKKLAVTEGLRLSP